MDEADYTQANEETFRQAALRSHFRLRHTPVDAAGPMGTEFISAPIGPTPCRDCGQAIPAKRLEAYPAAERCLGCQSRVESRR